MIRRDDAADWLLISQIDHAYAAADLAAGWGSPHAAPLPLPDLLIPAIRDHDEGWRDWERAPRVDPESGVPRQFLEMPMDEATAIWTRSIEAGYRRERSTASALATFQHFLATRSKRLTPDRARVAIEALTMREPFDADRVLERLHAAGTGRELSRSTVYRTLSWLEDAGLLKRDKTVRDRHVYEVAARHAGPSPLAGLWISRHFCFLAERARDARPPDNVERAAIDAFLEVQSSLQRDWTAAAATEASGGSVERLSELGFRWLQFFDRLSLWICCASRPQTEQMERPDQGAIYFTPLPSDEIAVNPFPFIADELTVTVTARRIPQRRYESDDDLQTALREAPLEPLRWSFVKW